MTKRDFRPAFLVALAAVLTPASASALDLELGSDGSDGALNVMSDTVVPLPADGVLNYTTVNIAAGATLSFSYAETVHPGVVLLATGDVVIDGTIDVSGEDGAPNAVFGAAGPGGTAGTNPVAASQQPALAIPIVRPLSQTPDVLRLTGGRGGRGGRCAVPANGYGGGGGGGALLIASNTSIRSSASALVDASGGEGVSGGACSTASQSGDDGRVRLISNRVSVSSLTIRAYHVRISSFETPMPPVVDGTLGMTTDNAMDAWPSVVPTSLIVAIDGEAVTPNTVHVLSDNTNPVIATVRVQGCIGSTMSVALWAHSGPSTTMGTTEATAPTGDDLVDVSVSPLAISGSTWALYAGVGCRR